MQLQISIAQAAVECSLLQSYELERRPVAIRNVSRAAEHMAVHLHYSEKCRALGDVAMVSEGEEAVELQEYIKNYVAQHDGENRDIGLEMDCRLQDSPIIVNEEGTQHAPWQSQAYTPSTVPGSRAPHVFLSDGRMSIYDSLGDDFTVVDFSSTGNTSCEMQELARQSHLPLIRLHLPNEAHVRLIWERDVVLVRPDHFVVWRCGVSIVQRIESHCKASLTRLLVAEQASRSPADCMK